MERLKAKGCGINGENLGCSHDWAGKSANTSAWFEHNFEKCLFFKWNVVFLSIWNATVS